MRAWRAHLLYTLLLCLGGTGLMASLPEVVAGQVPISLTSGRGDQLLGRNLELLRDPDHQWTIRDVVTPDVARQFEPSRQDVPSPGYDAAAYWIRFTVEQRDESANWLLEVSNKSLDDVRFYVPDGAGGYEETRVGDALPFREREIRDRNFVFSLPIPDSAATFYLRASSNGPLYFPVRVLSLDTYLQRSRISQLFLGLFFGAMLVMALYHLLLYVSVRDTTYLYYVLFIFYLILYEVSYERIGAEYLWPNNLWWADRANNTLILLTGIMALQFARSFLRTRMLAPRMDLLLLATMAFTVPLIALNVWSPANWITIRFCLAGHLVMIASGIVCLAKGDRSARYYLLAWSFFTVGGLLALAGYMQIIPPSSILATRGVQIGAVMEVTLFALGLGYRYNAMREERERLRLRIASDLHDDVGSGLTQITLNSELLRRAVDPKAADLAEQIGAQAHALALTMRDIVWSIEPKQDSWEALELRMKDYAIGLLGPAGVTLDMQGDLRFEHKTLPIEVRQNVLMLFKEVVHNAVKHAHCTEFNVRWRLDRKTLWMQLQDNGKGFDQEAASNGHGLGSMRRRSSAMNGQLTIDTAPGQPTTITIEVPLKEDALAVPAR